MGNIKAKGIDVSTWNGTLDWSKIKSAGIDFAIIRAGYGQNHIDAQFMANAKNAVAAGVDVGFYWFSYATTVEEAEKEADYLCDAVASTGVKVTYPLCYDYEYDSVQNAQKQGKSPSNNLIAKMGDAFLARVAKRGYYPANYTNIDFLGRGFNTIADKYDTWLAQWKVQSPSRECTLWQYSSDGSINGTSCRFDMNYAYVDYPSLIKKNGLNSSDDTKEYTTSEIETAWRNYVVNTAMGYLGRKESDGSHKEIIDIYNSVTPFPVGYTVKYTDAWCATFVSAVGIKAGLSDTIIPRECGCGRYINLCKNLGIWHENENYIPSPGDIVLYDWKDGTNYASTDDTYGADHIGYVQKVVGNTIYVIEGNYSDSVKIRQIAVNGRYLRGFALPKYGSLNKMPPDVPSSQDISTAYPVLRSGSSESAHVKKLQARLIQLGYSCGSSGADGKFGAATLAAVKSFQLNNGLTVDGIVGSQTWTALESNDAVKNTDTKSTSNIASGYPVLRKGSSGSYVKVLQSTLSFLGFDCGGIDGKFGQKTLTAVKAFQTKNGLVVDGIVGQKTWAALVK